MAHNDLITAVQAGSFTLAASILQAHTLDLDLLVELLSVVHTTLAIRFLITYWDQQSYTSEKLLDGNLPDESILYELFGTRQCPLDVLQRAVDAYDLTWEEVMDVFCHTVEFEVTGYACHRCTQVLGLPEKWSIDTDNPVIQAYLTTQSDKRQCCAPVPEHITHTRRTGQLALDVEPAYSEDIALVQAYGPRSPNWLRTELECQPHGCRMLLCVCNEPVDDADEPMDWFRENCDHCRHRIQRREYAVRAVSPEGGWQGCYCSWDCVPNPETWLFFRAVLQACGGIYVDPEYAQGNSSTG